MLILLNFGSRVRGSNTLSNVGLTSETTTVSQRKSPRINLTLGGLLTDERGTTGNVMASSARHC